MLLTHANCILREKGLLLASARCPDPVIFFEPKYMYRGAAEEVPIGDYEIPLMSAEVMQEGNDITVIGWGLVGHNIVAAHLHIQP